jgi:ABC-type phosphate/phosphonate transport system substrate-binding protein
MNAVNRLPRRLALGFVLCLSIFAATAQAEYVLSAPPRETPAQGQRMYGRLAEFLTGVLGKPVVYEHPGDWNTYARNMREGRYDILFDAPHFAAWRLEKQGAQPLVKLPGVINFVLVTHVAETGLNGPADLVGRQVCLLPSPSLGAVSAYAMYPNPVQQPEFVAMNGSWVDVADAVARGDCKAGVVRKNDYQNLISAETRGVIKVVGETRELTNQGITVSDRVPTVDRDEMLIALTGPAGLAAAEMLVKRFSAANPTLEPAALTDYLDHNLLTENMIFGW